VDLDPASYLWTTALRQALKHNRREAHSRYFQLATVDTEGKPRVRTVVYRGLDDDQQSPVFITDTRSAKMSHLDRQAVEVCWYFPISREQFRIAGQAEVFAFHHHQRLAVWQGLSDAARAQFFWPTPGEAVANGEQAINEGYNDRATPPPNFATVAIRPERIDHLRLSNPQRRMLSALTASTPHSATGWVVHEVNP
jgi:PPOX class probable FMN-dependent enzyme